MPHHRTERPRRRPAWEDRPTEPPGEPSPYGPHRGRPHDYPAHDRLLLHGRGSGDRCRARESPGIIMASILEGIDSPEQVRKLSLSELSQLAAEIRERLITVLSNNGGH